eukprot:COSAG01_NODE_3288_length_6308_cov_5.376228_1_plen_157_part_00
MVAPLLVMEGLGAGAPGARGTPKRPREEEEDPRQQEWEEELQQQAAAGWPELDPCLENHAADNDDAWSDAPTEPRGDDGADPDCQHTIDAPDDATVSELEQAWQRAARLHGKLSNRSNECVIAKHATKPLCMQFVYVVRNVDSMCMHMQEWCIMIE